MVAEVRLGKECIAEGEIAALIPACSAAAQQTIALEAPSPSRRTDLMVRVGLKDRGGRTIHSSVQRVTVFPRPAPIPPRERPFGVVLGAAGGPADGLSRGMGLRRLGPTEATGLGRGTTFLIDDWSLYRRASRAVSRAVRAGATAVFLELPPGSYDTIVAPGASVQVRATGMGEFFFVSRATGHPLVSAFQPDDFKFWYDPAEDCVMPLIGAVLLAPAWSPILSSGAVSWGGAGGPAQAAVERREGEGVVRICQVRLARMLVNPVAYLFARRLVGIDGPDSV